MDVKKDSIIKLISANKLDSEKKGKSKRSPNFRIIWSSNIVLACPCQKSLEKLLLNIEKPHSLAFHLIFIHIVTNKNTYSKMFQLYGCI